MKRPTPEQAELAARVWSMRTLPQRDIAKRAGCSLSTVNAILRQPPPDAAPPAVDDGGAADEVALAEQVVASGGSSEADLRGILARLQKAGRAAEADKDVARTVSVERVSMQVIALLERIKPEPVANPNDQPDMVAAAKAFREGAHAVLDRLLAGVSK